MYREPRIKIRIDMKYIDADRLKAEIKRRKQSLRAGICSDDAFTKEQKREMLVASEEIDRFNRIIDSLKQEMPDKETILRICKLHKAWSIMAPWENVEDFVMTNWNSENIV